MSDDPLFNKLLSVALEGYVEGKLARLAKNGKLEHEESEHCWCAPRCTYADPINGTKVWVHNEPEDAN